MECEEPGSSCGLMGAVKDVHWGWLWEKAISGAGSWPISPESACPNSAKESVLFSEGSQGQELQPYMQREEKTTYLPPLRKEMNLFHPLSPSQCLSPSRKC